jgi:hypothetical protein
LASIGVDAELTTCSDSIREALARLLEAREPFAAAIAAALQPERAAAARRALRAAMQLVSEFDLLDAIDREVAAVGGSAGQHPMRSYRASMEPLLTRLRQIAVSAPARPSEGAPRCAAIDASICGPKSAPMTMRIATRL